MLRKIKLYNLEGGVFLLLFLSLLTNAKYRLGDKNHFHFGGAEYAISPFDIPFVIILIAVIYRVLNHSFFIRKDIFNIVAFTYILSLIPSVVFSHSLLYSILEFFRELKFFIIFLWLRVFFERDESKKFFFYAVAIAVTFQGGLALSQIATGQTVAFISEKTTNLNLIAGGIVRVAGSFGHPGLLAQFLNITLTSLLIHWLASNKKGFNNLYLLIFLVGLFVLISTFSRTALGVQFFILFAVFYYSSSFISLKVTRFNKIMIFMVVFIGVATILTAFSEQIMHRFNTASVDSTSTRFVLASIALEMISQNPLTGVGLNNFVLAMPEYDETGLYTYWNHPVHNIYLLVAAELGVVTGIIFVIKLLVFLFIPLSILKSKKLSLVSSTFLFSACCGLIAIIFSGLLGWSWRLDSIHGVYWILLAMISSSTVNIRKGN